MFKCPKCGKELDVYPHKNVRTNKYTVIGTCRTDGCNRKNITLSVECLKALTDEQAATYNR